MPGAENSGSANTITNRREGTHAEVTSYEVDVVLQHVPRKRRSRSVVTFLGHNIVDVYRAKRDRRGA